MSTDNLKNIKQSLDTLGKAIEELAFQEIVIPEPADRSINGNKINGGMITNFSSVGIKDSASRQVVLVSDDGIITDNVQVGVLKGNPTVQGNLNVQGEITASKLHVNEITADIRNEKTSSLEFLPENGTVEGKGLIWVSEDVTDQLILRKNQHKRLWTTLNIDLHQDQSYMIDNVSVLSYDTLGPSVKKSSLTSLGTVQNLRTAGNLTIDEFIFFEDESQRLGIGIDQPNATLSVASEWHEIVIEPNSQTAKIGTHNTGDLDLVTDDTPRIRISSTGNIILGSHNENNVSVTGKLAVGVKNPQTDVSLTTAGPIRMQNKKMEVSNTMPSSGNYRKGDIVWNENPQPTGYVGWVCTRDGTPGVWKAFGQISK